MSWFKDVLEKCQEYGYRTTPVFENNNTKPYKDGQDYKNISDYKNAKHIGLILDDCLLLDYDGNKGEVISIDDLEEKLDLFEMPKEAQINKDGDSIHWLFKCDELGLSNANNGQWETHIDIKRGNQLMHIKPGKTLNLVDKDSLDIAPDELINALKGFGPPDSCDFDDALDIAISEETCELSEQEIRGYLSVLPNDYCSDHDNWMRVGMAVYHETKGSEEGYQLFDEFSKRCPDAYDEQHNRARWESFDSSGQVNKITFKSVIKWAGGKKAINGIRYDDIEHKIAEIVDTKDIEEVVQAIRELNGDKLRTELLFKKVKNKIKEMTGESLTIPTIKKIGMAGVIGTPSYVNDYVFLTSTGEYFHKETKAVMGPRSFDTKHSRETPISSEGERQSATMWTNDKIVCVENAMYVPKFGEIFTHEDLDYVNTYRPCLLDRVKQGESDIVDRIKGHIAHLLPDEDEQQIVIDYLAFNVQYPGVKIPWSIVLQGVQGDGKSLFAEMMQHVLGFNNVRIMNVQSLESSFTGWAEGQCMTFIEELKLDNYRKYEVLNNLKPYITNETIEVTKKGKDPRVVINTTNYFALTNFKDALPIDENDRRYCVLFSQWQQSEKLVEFMENNPGYYSELYNDMRLGAGELLDWLSNHKISEVFLAAKRAPLTKAKESMQLLSKSDDHLIVDDAIHEFECSDINKNTLNITKLQKLVSTEGNISDYEHFPKTTRLKNVLTDMGYHFIGVHKNKDRKNQRLYNKDPSIDLTDLLEQISDYEDDEI